MQEVVPEDKPIFCVKHKRRDIKFVNIDLSHIPSYLLGCQICFNNQNSNNLYVSIEEIIENDDSLPIVNWPKGLNQECKEYLENQSETLKAELNILRDQIILFYDEMYQELLTSIREIKKQKLIMLDRQQQRIQDLFDFYNEAFRRNALKDIFRNMSNFSSEHYVQFLNSIELTREKDLEILENNIKSLIQFQNDYKEKYYQSVELKQEINKLVSQLNFDITLNWRDRMIQLQRQEPENHISETLENPIDTHLVIDSLINHQELDNSEQNNKQVIPPQHTTIEPQNINTMKINPLESDNKIRSTNIVDSQTIQQISNNTDNEKENSQIIINSISFQFSSVRCALVICQNNQDEEQSKENKQGSNSQQKGLESDDISKDAEEERQRSYSKRQFKVYYDSQLNQLSQLQSQEDKDRNDHELPQVQIQDHVRNCNNHQHIQLPEDDDNQEEKNEKRYQEQDKEYQQSLDIEQEQHQNQNQQNNQDREERQNEQEEDENENESEVDESEEKRQDEIEEDEDEEEEENSEEEEDSEERQDKNESNNNNLKMNGYYNYGQIFGNNNQREYKKYNYVRSYSYYKYISSESEETEESEVSKSYSEYIADEEEQDDDDL